MSATTAPRRASLGRQDGGGGRGIVADKLDFSIAQNFGGGARVFCTPPLFTVFCLEIETKVIE